MKILTADQLRALDVATIQSEPIASIDLMERAARSCSEWIHDHYPDRPVTIIAGQGNNGGDGLAIARQLKDLGHQVEVIICKIGKPSDDFSFNRSRVEQLHIPMRSIDKSPIGALHPDSLVVDAIFGYGMNRPVRAPWSKIIEDINDLANPVVSIDLPSGLIPDAPSIGSIVEADVTLSFETPKRAFFIPENHRYVGTWHILPIGLDKITLSQLETSWCFSDPGMISDILRPRSKFDHKGTYGHALLVVGSFGKVGAAILAATAALRSGVGLLTVHVPGKAYEIMQITVPEAMILTDRHDLSFSGVDADLTFSSIGIGCGLGTQNCSQAGLADLLNRVNTPMVVDADGLNLLAQKPELLKALPHSSILTPHFKEFERLFGESENHFERLSKLAHKATELSLVIVLKGAHTAIAMPDGKLYFNSTGNPGMATAGSGDVLTGILTGLLAQQYTPGEAARLGVYLHGTSGDLAATKQGMESMVASDIVEEIGQAYQLLKGRE